MTGEKEPACYPCQIHTLRRTMAVDLTDKHIWTFRFLHLLYYYFYLCSLSIFVLCF